MNQQRRRSNHALAFLAKYEPKGRPRETQEIPQSPKAGEEGVRPENGGDSKALVRPASAEIIPPQPSAISALAPNFPDLPSFEPVEIAPLQAVLRETAHLLDFSEPEGVLDRLFGRPDYRIEIKTERALRLARFKAALTENVAEIRRTIEEVRALDRERHGRYLDTFTFAREALEAQERLKYARASAARQDAVEAAKAKALIAQHEAQAEMARLSALPLPPTPPEPSPVDEATRKREEARRIRKQEIELNLDETEERAAASEEMVARAKNRCIEIYRDLTMREGEKRARIQRVLDEYGFDCTILPAAIEELMIRGDEEVDQ